jgi:hypothetical protein
MMLVRRLPLRAPRVEILGSIVAAPVLRPSSVRRFDVKWDAAGRRTASVGVLMLFFWMAR